MPRLAELSIELLLCVPALASAATFLNTPGSVMFELAARATRSVPGLPMDTGRFSGFYPRRDASG